MATTQDFVNAMEEIYKNHGVYIGTGNGELTEALTIGEIHRMEMTYARRDSQGNPLWNSDTRRDLKYIGDCYDNGYDMSKSRAGDCSGIIVGVLRDLKVIKPSADYRARDFQRLSTPVKIKDLQPGDLVFNTTSDASHIGVYIGNGMVIDSRGRDVGVVRRSLDNYNKWVIGGRLDWFDGTIPPLTRNLRYIEGDLMKGEDVKQCQEQLVKKDFKPGIVDGIFGLKTEGAVLQFQIKNNLEVDGIVGQKTWNALFS